MAFACQCCGDCCSTMGEIIAIREETGPGRFRIGFTNGEERIVSLDPDKIDLFTLPHDETKKVSACPFLRPQGPGRRICTVHASRPEICRGYLCSRILVLDSAGNHAGRVLPGTRIFTTTDTMLLELWHSHLKDCAIPDDSQWEERVGEIVTRAGYRVIR